MVNHEYAATVAALVNDYRADPETRELASLLDIVTVSGPTGVGKVAVMGASGLNIMRSSTTRDRRNASDNAYNFIDTSEQRQKLLVDLSDGVYVEATIHPTTGDFYGLNREDVYLRSPSLLPAFPSQYRKFVTKKLFRTVRPAYITAPSFDNWQARLTNDGNFRQSGYDKQLSEAIKSLNTALDNDDFYFMINNPLAIAANSLRRFALLDERNVTSNLAARRAGQSMLRGLIRQQADALIGC